MNPTRNLTTFADGILTSPILANILFKIFPEAFFGIASTKTTPAFLLYLESFAAT
jgi:hypothetical protein